MERQKEKETVSLENLVLSQTYTMQALINVLERKGILTKDEVLEELKNMENLVVDDDETVN